MKTQEIKINPIASIFEKAEGFGKLYGKPLYEFIEEIGVVGPEHYALNLEEANIMIEDENGVKLFVQIKQSLIEEGIEDDYEFRIGKFVASRDETGEYLGETWSVVKGTIKLFAY